MKTIIQWIKRLFGYKYYTYEVHYIADKVMFTYISGPGDIRLGDLATKMRLNKRELYEMLIDTCTCGGINSDCLSLVTIEVKKGHVKVVNNKITKGTLWKLKKKIS